MPDPFFFGYGSLVNTRTHNYETPTPARVTGWRRAWRHIAANDVATLTAVPAGGQEIDGLIAHVPGNDWAALDIREVNYTRGALAADMISHDHPSDVEVQIYQVNADLEAEVTHPILLSYLDVVVQGYLDVFGEAGVHSFFDTTDGWTTPVLNDRAAPRYPRHQQLSLAEQNLVDGHLARLSAKVQQL